MTRSILITGCSSGIGLASAHYLAARHWHVIASCRKGADVARLRDLGFDAVQLDYADPTSVAGGLEAALALTGGRLDALFNNGAYALPGAVEDLPRDGLRAIFETNLFGLHDLTARVIPLMRAQQGGRIVNCSSVLGFVPAPWRGAYVATKYALEGLTDVMRMEMADTPLRISLICPGPINTKIRQNSQGPFERWIAWEGAARAEQYRDTLIPRLYEPPTASRFERSPQTVAGVLHRALTAPRPRARYYVTTPTRVAAILRRVAPRAALERLLRGV